MLVRTMPRVLDERTAADLFFAELTGQPLRRSRFGESIALAEDDPVVRSAVMNPGWSSWGVMVANQPSKSKTFHWAGAIRQRSDYSKDYTGWDDKSASFTIEKLRAGAKFDILTTAKIKGRLKTAGKDEAYYVKDATVKAFAPQPYSDKYKVTGVIDVEVGYEDDNKKLRFVKASWDRDKECARVDIPVRVTYGKRELPPDEFIITWFGNQDSPVHPFNAPTP